MARITSKQAKELMEAYASVHNLQERQRFDPSKYDLTKPMGGLSQKDYDALDYSERENIRRRSSVSNMNTTAKEVNLDKKTGEKVEVTNVTPDGTAKRVDNQSSVKTQNNQTTEKPSTQNNNNQQSTQSNNNQQSTQSNNNNQQSNTLTTPSGRESNLSDYAKSKVASMRNDMNTAGVKSNEGPSTVSSVNSTGTAQKVDNQSSSGSTGGSVKFSGQQLKGLLDSQKGIGNKGNQTTPSSQQPAPQQSSSQARPAPQQSSSQTRPAPQAAQGSAAQGAQQQRTGALGRLGSLAGRAANAARNAASGIKQVATSTASNIKKGAQAVSGALANKGPIQGRASGPQRRAQQAQQRTQQAQPAQQQTQPAQQQTQPAAKPVLSNNSPAAKAGIPLNMRQAAADKNAKFQAARKSGNMAQYRKENPKLSGADRAKAMARERIAAKKAAPAKPVQKKVTSVMDMEGYDPMENLFDDTVQFLVSEGHAKDKSEAISIMSESEFIDAFNQELNE